MIALPLVGSTLAFSERRRFCRTGGAAGRRGCLRRATKTAAAVHRVGRLEDKNVDCFMRMRRITALQTAGQSV